MLRAFQSAITSGSASQLAAILSSDIRLTSDSGGKASAVLRVLQGGDVLAVLRRATSWWEPYAWRITNPTGGRGAILTSGGQPMLTISFRYNQAGQVSDIFVMRNPDKLARLDPVVME